ncbi:flagellar hook-associated protein FlgK [Demequina sp.]|uniref:flagellar hook-associated protein FlgK n=1 Tax=Demequina sp. TaxID=2050685 RepID=UPI003A8AF727
MSTFSGLSTALSSLMAQRIALEVSGQNIANANTAGYTRQRADLEALTASSVSSLFSTPVTSGSGVSATGIARLGDQFADSRLRFATAQASHHSSIATAFSRLESVVSEPADTGVASGLQAFWSAWEDLSNGPDSSANRTAVMGAGQALVGQLADTYRAYEAQWNAARSDGQSLVAEVQASAQGVAELNEQIRSVLAAGSSANELMDQRDLLVTRLSALVGATATAQHDGTVTVMVSGNPLVQGDRATGITLGGSAVMTQALGEPAPTAATAHLEWADGTALVLNGGELAGIVTALQPTSLGGPLSSSLDAVNGLASDVAARVNALHSAGTTLAGAPYDTGVDFFSFQDGMPPALGLAVAITDPQHVAAATAGAGAFDGSVASALSQIGASQDGPDATWREFVVELGVTAAAATRRASVSETARTTAQSVQLAATSVDVDEEVTNMLAYQRAYEGAARVLTAMDEMLDTLINRTGVVGR